MSLVLVPLLGLVLGPSALAQCPPLPAAGGQQAAPFSCTFDTMLTRLFTPRSVPKDVYRAYVTPASVDQVVHAFKATAESADAEGAWGLQRMDPLDAFGTSGPYDRAKLARLYVGVRPRVTHGPIVQQGRTVASITLVSPYPDASLSRLNPGTLIIEFRVPRDGSR